MKLRGFAAALAAGAGVLGAFATGAAAQDDNVFKLAFVAFLSGPAAESFGKPAVQGAKTVIDALNAGSLPKPYDKIGFGGLKIEVQLIDEAGGATKQVEELRNAFERDHVDAVLGYVSSGDCLAVSPAAEELKKLLVLFDCGTPRIFEENKFKYVFRTAAHGAMDNVAMARYLVKRGIKVPDVGAINQDYAWGQDSWKDFKGSLAQLEPEAKAKVELWPKFGAGQYGTEISTLLQENPALVYSSLWGGDLQAFVLQAAPRGLMKDRVVVLERLRPRAAAARQQNARRRHCRRARLQRPVRREEPDQRLVRGRLGRRASGTSFRCSRTIAPRKACSAVKTAVEKAMAANGGKKPTTEEMAAAMVGMEWDAPSGHIKLALGDGHQAIQSNAAGRSKWDADAKMVRLIDIVRFAAECVNPPPGIKSADWIAEGFTGAKCN